MLAPNPGPFTGPGTNTYVVGDDLVVAVIDPGPVDRSHESAIIEVVGDRRVEAVVVTHTHEDHAPLANPLATGLEVPALGYASGPAFEPDDLLVEGSALAVGDIRIEVLYTPGHSDDHVCFKIGESLFTGDHIMGGSSVMVTDLGPYMASLERLKGMHFDRMYPGHGPEIEEPDEVVSWYLEHRRQREREILAAVRSGADSVGSVVETVYAGVDSALYPLATFNVVAHLRKLAADGLVVFAGEDWTAQVEATELRGNEAT